MADIFALHSDLVFNVVEQGEDLSLDSIKLKGNIVLEEKAMVSSAYAESIGADHVVFDVTSYCSAREHAGTKRREYIFKMYVSNDSVSIRGFCTKNLQEFETEELKIR